jgi:hypothetical protein
MICGVDRRGMLGVAALAAASLLLESTLTRLLAVAQFYHFAFLVVSLALLGFGASGTVLALTPRLQFMPLDRLLTGAGIGFAVSVAAAYAAVNFLPFDSYSLAWERRQILFFLLYYLALALPFLCAGIGIGAALAGARGRSHLVYAANLLGSAAGVLVAPAVMWLSGVPGAVLISALIGTAPAVLDRRSPRMRLPAGLLLLVGLAGFCALSVFNLGDRAPLGMKISPYKGLSQALRYPGARSLFGRWDSISRIDVIADAGTRNMPGLSYMFPGAPPAQHGLSLDAESLQPLSLVAPEGFYSASYMPEAAAFQLRSGGTALVLEPGGGLGILQALASGARTVVAVEGDPLLRRAVAMTNPLDPYALPGVRAVLQSGRRYLRRSSETFDVIAIPLTDAYRPVASGAYSLAETYGLTAEAFEDALDRLAPGGLLVATRWLQIPPSEDLRLVATAAEALARRGIERPGEALVAYRGIQTLTVLAKPDGWQPDELERVREFARSRRYDMVWAPGIQPEETNIFNRTPTSMHYEAVRDLLRTFPEGRDRFYAGYPFAISPPTDDHPFFFHFFRWGQTPRVLATLGRTWQPFGGSGYLVLFALLALVLVLSAVLIILPLAFRRQAVAGPHPAGLRLRVVAYFGLLGLAFLFVELPIIQRWILLFGQPIYAFTAAVLTILLFSGLGSASVRSPRVHARAIFLLLVVLALAVACAGTTVNRAILGWPDLWRTLVAVASLAPLAFLMGMPFPLGLAWLERASPALVPWAWAVNGCASVVASVLAAILALSAGFTAVLLVGAAAYAAAGAVLWARMGGGFDSQESNGVGSSSADPEDASTTQLNYLLSTVANRLGEFCSATD